MAILDKLMEKKDLLAYINFRSKMLQISIQQARHAGKPQHRESIIKANISRLKELRLLKGYVVQGELKSKSIEFSEWYYKMSKKEPIEKGTEKEKENTEQLREQQLRETVVGLKKFASFLGMLEGIEKKYGIQGGCPAGAKGDEK